MGEPPSQHKSRLSSLNEWQKKAVETTDGKLLVLAGAGSGKTTVLTKRIVYLLDKGVDPDSILGLTFTNKAAREMSDRLAGAVGRTIAKKVHLSTFHSFALYVLRKEAHHLGIQPHFTIADRQDVLRHLQAIVRDLLDHDQGDIPSLQCLLEDISMAKNKCVPIEEVAQLRPSSWYTSFARSVFDRLEHCFRVYSIVDFDHMLYLVDQLFMQNETVLDRYRERFRYVMIDEYQDTNPIQARIAQKLASKWGNLCVVGDDDQSIYSWRGADVANILHFDADVVVKLEQNFRSTPVILNAANSVIKVNQERYDKSLWSVKQAGQKINVFVAPNEEAEADAVVKRIVALREKYGLAWGDFCILYRSNTLSKPIETALLKARYASRGRIFQSIPYRVFGGDEIYEHKEVKDILSYLKVAINPLDREAFLRSINYPRRGVGEASIDNISKYVEQHNCTFIDALQQLIAAHSGEKGSHIPQKALLGMSQYCTVIQRMRALLLSNVSLETLVQELIVMIDLKGAIYAEVKSEAMRKWKEERLKVFLETIRSFDRKGEGEELPQSISAHDRLHSFLSAFQLQEERHSLSPEGHDENSVSLMTFHGSKGLEFPVCFLVGIEDHLIPHEKSLADRGLEEERRLMYVALTRAKERLFISMAMKRKRLGVEASSRPSRFVLDIPSDCIEPVEWHAAQRV